MTIYFTGTERDAVEGGRAITTNTTYFDTRYSSSAIAVRLDISCGATLLNEIGANSVDGFWLGFSLYTRAQRTREGKTLEILTDNNNLVLTLIGQCCYGNAQLTLYNSANQTNVSTSYTVPMYAVMRYDIHCFTENGEAKAELYINNLLVASARIAGQNRGIKVVKIYPGASVDDGGDGGFVSEIIIADESTLGMRVKTYRPIADGFHKTWAGNYDNVNNDDVGIDAISTSISNAAETFLHGATLSEGTAIRALAIGAAIASSNPTAAKAILNIDGTLYQKNFVKPLAQGAPPNVAIYEVNPATGLSFTPTNFNNLEFGVQHS